MKQTIFLVFALLLAPVMARAAAGEGSYTTNPDSFVYGDGGQSMAVDFTAGATAFASTGGLISVFFPLGFPAPTQANFYIQPAQQGYLLTGGSTSYQYGSQGVTIQVKSLPAAGSLQFWYGYNPGGFTVATSTASVALTVYSDPSSLTLTPQALSAQPTIAIRTATPTVTTTATQTPTISPTFTVSPTLTFTPTVTPTFTETPLGPATENKVYTYPNPFDTNTRSQCTFRFPVGLKEPVEIRVYNMIAEPVRDIPAGNINVAEGWATWDGRDDRFNQATGGLYLVRVKSADRVFTNKFVVYH